MTSLINIIQNIKHNLIIPILFLLKFIKHIKRILKTENNIENCKDSKTVKLQKNKCLDVKQ